MSGTVWFSGRFVGAARAHVPATSTSVLQGVGVYEALRVIDGESTLLPFHLERLRAGCRAAGLELEPRDWADILRALARRNRLPDAKARITIGDGFTLLHLEALPADLAQERKSGTALVTVSHARENAERKSTSRMGLWLAEREAGGEALLVDSRGRALETSRSNFFIVSGRRLQTAPLPAVLPGVARRVLFEIAAGMGLKVTERPPALGPDVRWSEAFVCNAVRGIRPVSRIDRRRLPRPGNESITRSLQRALDLRMGLP